MKVTRCEKCGFPNTRPGGQFVDGVCLSCINYENRSNVDYNKRFEELKEIARKIKKNNKGLYDVVLPSSGGKDSTYIADIMVNKLGLRALSITVNDSFSHSEAGSHNSRNYQTVFNVNNFTYTISHDLFKRATRAAFENPVIGGPLKFVEYAIYTIPTMIAQKLNIPLVVYGENSTYEYGCTTNDYFDATKDVEEMSNQLEKDRKWWINNGVSEQEINSIQLDKTAKLPQVIYMSYFTEWDSPRNREVARKLGFKDLKKEGWLREGCIEDYEQMDSHGYMVHLQASKFYKFAYARASDIASRRVRQGILTRDQAIELMKKDYEFDQTAIDSWCEALGYTLKEFWEIIERHVNKDLFHKDKFGVWKINE